MEEIEFKNNILLSHLDEIHTTDLGYRRIAKATDMPGNIFIDYIKDIVKKSETKITKIGKNYYLYFKNLKVTINSYNYCVITVHTIKTK